MTTLNESLKNYATRRGFDLSSNDVIQFIEKYQGIYNKAHLIINTIMSKYSKSTDLNIIKEYIKGLSSENVVKNIAFGVITQGVFLYEIGVEENINNDARNMVLDSLMEDLSVRWI